VKKDSSWTGAGPPVYLWFAAIESYAHGYPSIGGGAVEAINPKNIWILLAIAAGVLLIACINFTTLVYWPFRRKGKRSRCT
jgi:hypothetical protein